MFSIIAYIAAITAANLSIAAFGPWVSPINAFLLIGLDLALRDHLHDRWRGPWLWPRMLALIAVAGLASYVLNPAAGRIALASMASFCIAGLVDAIAYHALRKRPYLQRSNGSNAAGALADSLIFPALAFGVWLPAIVALQFAAKTIGGSVWAYAIWKWGRG
jgi:hypothetical protein